MAVKQKEYLLSVNDFKEPSTLNGTDAIGTMLIRLILMDPYTDPLRPGMGVGLRRYRYGLNNLEELRATIDYQIKTYLPNYQNAIVNISVSPDKICNIEITIDDTVYIYETAKGPYPITLSSIQSE